MERTPQHRNRYTQPAHTTRGRDYSAPVRSAPTAPISQPADTPAQQPADNSSYQPAAPQLQRQPEPHRPFQYGQPAPQPGPPQASALPINYPQTQHQPHRQGSQHHIVAAPAPPPPFHTPPEQQPAQHPGQPNTRPVPANQPAGDRSQPHYVGPPHHDYQPYLPDEEPTQQEWDTIDFEPPEAKRNIHFVKIRNKLNAALTGFKAYYSASPRRAALVITSSVLVLTAIGWTLALQSKSANELLAKTPFSFLLIKQGNTKGEEVIVLEDRPTPEQISEHRTPAKNPRYMSIPKFNLFSRVLALESKDEGIELPDNIYDVGWSTQSNPPGDPLGTQLYIGHAKGITKADAAFSRLTELKVGDDLIIETGEGTKYTYSVVYTEKANVSSPNISRYYNSWVIGQPGLNLLTTSGVDPSKENPSENRYATFAVFTILKK